MPDERSPLLEKNETFIDVQLNNEETDLTNMEDGDNPEYGIKSTVIQIGLCIIASIAQLSAGMTMGFSAVTGQYMQQKNSYVSVTSDEASWIASLATISIPVGCLVSGPIIDRWGRKTGLLLLNLPSFLGWLLISIQPDLYRIYLGRILTGFASGLSSVPATVYFAEAATKSMRGLLINGTSVSISAGVLIVYTLGYFLKEDWRMVATICSLFPVAAAIMIAILLPESPQWLISKGCNKKAHNSLKVIRGVPSTKEVQQEFDSMLDQNKSNRRHKLSFVETFSLFRKPQVYKPFIIMNLFFFLQQFSGIFVVIFYAVDVVQNSGVSVDPYLVSVMIALIRLLFTISGAGLSKQLGRRPLAIFSGVGMTVSLLFLIYHLHHPGTLPAVESINNKTIDLSLVESMNNKTIDLSVVESINNKTINLSVGEPINKITDSYGFNGTSMGVTSNQSSISWWPVISILFYVLSSTVGFLTLPWAMIGEVFPSQVRGVAGGLTTCLAYIASFVTIKSYPYLLDSLHQSGIYTIFGVMALIGTIFVIFFLPETQGKTLKEIEDYFAGKGKLKRSNQDKDDFTENKIMLSSVRKPEIVSQGKSSQN